MKAKKYLVSNGQEVWMIRYLLAVTLFLTSGFQIFAQDSLAGNQKKKILLAYETTEFKTDLVKKMKSLLEKDTIEVRVIEHSKGALDKENPGDYGAIFISNSGVNSQVRPWINDWISKNEKYSSRIILHTTQTHDWKVEVSVDAVTSASNKRDGKRLAAEYVKMLKNRLTSATATSPSSDEQQKN